MAAKVTISPPGAPSDTSLAERLAEEPEIMTRTGTPTEGYRVAPLKAWGTAAVVCMNFTYLQVASAILTHVFCEIGPRFKDIDPKEIEVFGMVRLVLVPLLFFELAFNLFKTCIGSARTNSLVISRVAIWEILVQISYYTVLTKYDGGYAHLNLRSPGYPRPIYLPRFIGWSFAVPTLLLLCNYPVMDQESFPVILHRIFPQMAVQWAYCWTCYLGCVVYNPWVGWYLLTLGCLGYLVSVAEQVAVIADVIFKISNPVPKLFLILMKENMYTLYTFVYLFGMWGFMTNLSCESFYSWADISCKGTTIVCIHLFRIMDSGDSGRKEE